MAFTKKIQILVELSGNTFDSVDRLNTELIQELTEAITDKVLKYNTNYTNKISLNFDITNNLDKNLKNTSNNCG